MSATQSVEPRRTSPPSAGTNRELPVLFHLMDVSRLKSPPAAAVLSAPTERHYQAEIAEAPLAFKLAAPEPPPAVETTGNSPGIEAPAHEDLAAPVASAPTADSVETPAEEIAPSPAPAADQDIAVQLSAGETAENAPPATAPVAVPRKEAGRRPAKAKSQRGNEWFANQGRYIAIGFVLALIGTIFIARSNRGTSPAAAVQPHAHPGEAGQQIAASETKPATVVGKLQEKQSKEANANKTATTSPASPAEAAAGENVPQADLHPPTIPQLVREPPSNQPDNNALFPWTEQPADRLAARPDAPSASPPPTPPTQYPVTAASGPPSPSYPTTATPNSNFAAPPQQPPVAPPDYRSPYIPAPPANSQPTNLGQSFVPPAGGPSPTYLPSDNTARGYRYERTGSGPY